MAKHGEAVAVIVPVFIHRKYSVKTITYKF
jgi:antitoxin (DNA-binding transcriptional repressor) of toxin-antitoxin stability system